MQALRAGLLDEEVNDGVIQELPIIQSGEIMLCYLHHIKLLTRRVYAV